MGEIMWIPVIIVAWGLGGSPVWINFPMVNFPFSTKVRCIEYTKVVRDKVQRNPAYVAGYSACIEIPQGEQT